MGDDKLSGRRWDARNKESPSCVRRGRRGRRRKRRKERKRRKRGDCTFPFSPPFEKLLYLTNFVI